MNIGFSGSGPKYSKLTPTPTPTPAPYPTPTPAPYPTPTPAPPPYPYNFSFSTQDVNSVLAQAGTTSFGPGVINQSTATEAQLQTYLLNNNPSITTQDRQIAEELIANFNSLDSHHTPTPTPDPGFISSLTISQVAQEDGNSANFTQTDVTLYKEGYIPTTPAPTPAPYPVEPPAPKPLPILLPIELPKES